MKAQLAFYKGKGNLVDKAIRWWTKSDYSHVELVVDGIWFSTSPRLQRVKARILEPTEGHWDYLDVEVDHHHVIDFYGKTDGAKYDWLGIFLSQFLRIKTHSGSRWFCSEWCAEALKLENSNEYSPEDLFLRYNS